jgi:hypothetical protein
MESSWRGLEVQVNYAHTKSIIVQIIWDIARCKFCAQRTNLVCVCVCVHVHYMNEHTLSLIKFFEYFNGYTRC